MLCRGHRRRLAACLISALSLSAAILTGANARAQTSAPQASGSSASAPATAPINLGGRGWSSFASKPAEPEDAKRQLEFEFRAGLASDYIYRGVTLSDRKPAVG